KKKCKSILVALKRHHCSHQATNIYQRDNKPCMISEYVAEYFPYKIEPRESFKPKNEYKREPIEMEHLSVFRADYVPHDVKPKPPKVPEEYKKPDGPMYMTTSYKRDYNPHPIPPPVLLKPPERKCSVARLDTIPTYKDDYRLWKVPKREPIKPEPYRPSSAKFYGLSTFQRDYQPKGMSVRDSCKPPNAVMMSTVPFDGTTNYRLEYMPHVLEPRKMQDKATYKPSDVPFDGLSTHRQDFRVLQAERVKSLKPKQNKVASDAKFNEISEFQQQYKPWALPPRHVNKVAVYVPPEEKMNLSSTTHTDYPVHKLQLLPCRPVVQARSQSVPFDAQSTMKEDYKQWELQQVKMIKHPEAISWPADKFENVSTFQAHYVPHDVSHTHKFKPVNQVLHSSGPFDGETIYHSSYVPRQIKVCPAIQPTLQGYVYDETDACGHKRFRPMPDPQHTRIKQDAKSGTANVSIAPEKPVNGFAPAHQKQLIATA
uniref:Stabilizer of axonemal microtubules 1 n=1 Tax=Latimeria chalumnae TaxID=7897 RepID=H3BE28_LATCH